MKAQAPHAPWIITALVSPLALIPNYREEYPWLFERIKQIQQICNEPLPLGLLKVHQPRPKKDED